MSLRIRWECQNCANIQEIEYATTRKYLNCFKCGRVHIVTGLHTNGAPIVHLIAAKQIRG